MNTIDVVNMFDNPTETSGIVKTFKEWKAWKIETTGALYKAGYGALHEHFIDDIDGVKYLSERMGFGGFMTSPIARLDNKSITAKTITLAANDRLFGFYEKYDDKAQQIYLYDLTFHPTLPKYEWTSIKNNETYDCEPIIDNDLSHWNIRFGILN